MIGVLSAIVATMVLLFSVEKIASINSTTSLNSNNFIVASQWKQVNSAANAYIITYSSAAQGYAIQNNTTWPLIVTQAQLASASGGYFLPASFPATNSFGQSWVLEIQPPLLPVGNGYTTVNALVLSQGGRPNVILHNKTLTSVAGLVGASGGVIPSTATVDVMPNYPQTSATAVTGGWSVPTTGYVGVGTTGQLATSLTLTIPQKPPAPPPAATPYVPPVTHYAPPVVPYVPPSSPGCGGGGSVLTQAYCAAFGRAPDAAGLRIGPARLIRMAGV